MTYDDAISSIRLNTFNLGSVPLELIDVPMMRFAAKRHIWAAEAYCPKKLKQYWLNITLDRIVPKIDPITNKPFKDIL